MKELNRREALKALSVAGSALLLGSAGAVANQTGLRRTKMGIVTYAFGIHQKNRWGGRYSDLAPSIALLEQAHELDTQGIQVDLATVDSREATDLRRRADTYGMYIEASLAPPKTAQDVERFEKGVVTAKAAGAVLARTVLMPGRRYEEFKSLEEFKSADRHALQSLQLAEPVLARHRFRLAVENHKDQRIPEKLAMLKSLGSEFVGLCVDVGNSFTLMEDPLDTVQAYAPYAFTAHFKDQAVREKPDGFWFADVPLGEGFLDLPAIIKTLRAAKPDIHLNLELITRDPLDVACLKQDFWVTMPDLPAANLARVISTVRRHSVTAPFLEVSTLAPEQQMALELSNVQKSLAFARDHLGLV